MTEPDLIVAAGAVVVRKGPEVLLVHRPKYDDWSFPKGKLDPGEHVTTAAVREVAEETGLDVRLGPPLSTQAYQVRNGWVRPKLVHYWVARVVHDDDVSTYRPNAEIDAVAWVPLDKAAEMLTYERDRETLAEAARVRKKSHPLVVLRHGRAAPRKRWTGDDRKRPLADGGRAAGRDGGAGARRVRRRAGRQLEQQAVLDHGDARTPTSPTSRWRSPRSCPRRTPPRRRSSGSCTSCWSAASRSCCAPTGRSCRTSTRPSGCATRSSDPGSMLVVHHRRGQVVGLEQHEA